MTRIPPRHHRRRRHLHLRPAGRRVAPRGRRRCSADNEDLEQTRVAFLVPPSFAYAAVQRGIWRAGGVAVPLAVSHPPAELEYVIRDAGASVVVGDPACAATLAPLAQRRACAVRDDRRRARGVAGRRRCRTSASTRRAMIIYTSGTTGRPKGVVTTHQNIGAQIASLVEAWGWTPVGSPAARAAAAPRARHHQRARLGAGGARHVRDAAALRRRARVGAAGVGRDHGVHRGADHLQPADRVVGRRAARRAAARGRTACAALRLMMSGSAALPVQMLERWREITGHTLLERYGMTEIGMALSNPLDGERRPGFVGHAAARRGRAPGGRGRHRGAGRARRASSRCAGRPCSASTGSGRRRRAPRSATAGSAPATWPWWSRALPAARPHQRGHHQDRRVQGVGARDRRGAAHAPGASPSAPSWAWPTRSGANACRRRWSCGRARRCRSTTCRRGRRTLLAPYKVPRALSVVAALPRNAMGKVVKPEVARLFK